MTQGPISMGWSPWGLLPSADLVPCVPQRPALKHPVDPSFQGLPHPCVVTSLLVTPYAPLVVPYVCGVVMALVHCKEMLELDLHPFSFGPGLYPVPVMALFLQCT